MINLVSLLSLYLGEDAVYDFINNMIRESKDCTDTMKTKTLLNVGFVIMFMLTMMLK